MIGDELIEIEYFSQQNLEFLLWTHFYVVV